MDEQGHEDSDFMDERQPRHDADKGREPELLAGRMGTRMISRAALVERITAQFYEEYGDDSPALREAKTQAQRLRLVLDTADYVLSVESVVLVQDAKADLIRQCFSDLFGYGPLDSLLSDPQITTISIVGADHTSVRYGSGELKPLGPLFEDNSHLQRIVARLVMDAGAELREDQPVIEAGLRLGERPAALNLVAPPMSPVLSVDLRLHPVQARSLDDLEQEGMLNSEAAFFLKTLAASPYGLIIVGEAETGKTTLMSALANLLADPSGVVSVERAGELRLPPKVRRLTAQWAVGNAEPITFGQQISAALEVPLSCLLLDEVRADEPLTITPLLEADDMARQWWTFRGVPDAKRLQSALGMLARRAGYGQGEALVHALYDRLPFVVTVQRIRERLQLFSIAEWQPNETSDYPDYVMLFKYQEGESRPTGKRPSRAVALG